MQPIGLIRKEATIVGKVINNFVSHDLFHLGNELSLRLREDHFVITLIH